VTSYRDAGVDLDIHSKMHQLAKRVVLETGASLGKYASSITFQDVELVLHVDGVGTKTLVLEKLGKLWVAGWDCVVMNTNDVACDGAKPLAVVDYIALPRSDENLFKQVINGIESAVKELNLVLLGGETAILPDLANGVDVVCTVLAFKDKHIVNEARIGDKLYGLPSNGLHANGYSLVRKIVREKLKNNYRAVIDGVNLELELAKPVANYTSFLLEAWNRKLIHAAAHITGGSFTKIKRILPRGATAYLKVPEPPQIFKLMVRLGSIKLWEAYRVFNMGIGLVVTADQEAEGELRRLAKQHGYDLIELGYVRRDSRENIIVETWTGEKLVY